MAKDTNEVRIVKLEQDTVYALERSGQIESRVDKLENNSTQQSTLLTRLTDSVEVLSQAVVSLNHSVDTMNLLVLKIDKDLDATKIRFAALVAVLTPVALSLLGIAIKFLFSGS